MWEERHHRNFERAELSRRGVEMITVRSVPGPNKKRLDKSQQVAEKSSNAGKISELVINQPNRSNVDEEKKILGWGQ